MTMDARLGGMHLGAALQLPVDVDPEETREWLDAFDGVVRHVGVARGRYLLQRLIKQAGRCGIAASTTLRTAYCNTLHHSEQGLFSGDLELERQLAAWVRWNAMAMVVQANRREGELGGHIASYASAADLFEVGFNHFFRAGPSGETNDLVFFQAHSAPGIYARAYLEGRLSERQLANYRREVGGEGLCSYPHPWSMPDFWQFPTGSMGLGPISAIYQARFMRYLQHRHLRPSSTRHVWGFFGDGEMDEPESLAALGLAAREGLDNLTFVINCNLQRLDGPVRGNGKVIEELEAQFLGAGWNVIKVLWGSEWDALLDQDHDGVLQHYLDITVDGEYQSLSTLDGAARRQRFFARHPRLLEKVAHLEDSQLEKMRRGGHDPLKIHAAYTAALACKGRPTVILAKTEKGHGMGRWGQGKMIAHQQKQLDDEALLAFRDRFALPLSDDDVRAARLFKPEADSLVMRYLHSRRQALHGYLPSRSSVAVPLETPAASAFAGFASAGESKPMSTTLAFVRMLGSLLKAPVLGERIVPIVADEARTFGMANLFHKYGIYSPQGQLYTPEDKDSIVSYREARDGQILEEGITEAGAMSSWIAAGTAYSTHGMAMLPVYIFYSMFGFQRVADLIWAAADQRTRGFLIGATSGRTTLAGEGLQHQDGSSHVVAATVPNCRAYDPAFAGELAVIVDHGLKCMMTAQEDVFYYLTVTNENYLQRPLPDGAEADVIKGMYLLDTLDAGPEAPLVRLLGSGAILNEVLSAANRLRERWGVTVQVWSVTSFSELERDARSAQHARLAGTQTTLGHVEQCLGGSAPVVAATDYVRAYAQLIAPYVSAPFKVLGTDGFGCSDTRGALRRYFEVDSQAICLTALQALVEQGRLAADTVAKARCIMGGADNRHA
ncbi:Pyruvate dehydrogenase E1 component [Pseudomonas fluorescens]|nr:Pyruvate dehydrogenase E1 component [Pseudomonas fluorescens]